MPPKPCAVLDTGGCGSPATPTRPPSTRLLASWGANAWPPNWARASASTLMLTDSAAHAWQTRRDLGATMGGLREASTRRGVSMGASDDPVLLVRPAERQPGPVTPGMDRQQSFHTEGMWSGFVRTEPGMTSGWHH